ncbi:MAG: cysteine--tRNA ligase [Bacilli bacterium]|nr:cysteine--tRNA ligase [Bacilli bacterium]
MKIYNTLTKKVEEFIPNDKKQVKMYTCGPTVYNYAHIGNLRTYVFEDILEKTLNYIGYDVKRCMNITDVGHMTSDADTGEDKMLKGAQRENKTVYEIAQFYTDAFFSDLKDLNIKKPDIISKASDNIDEYIKIVEQLLKKGYAYLANNNVYFDVSKVSNYYDLSGKNKEDLLVAVREDVEEDEFKRNPADFGLWFTVSKFSNQVMKWDSPWGIGYPGWHIECSGIALKYLGDKLDIHCGGVDNIFPHHTNEIAQSESFIGHTWCKYWMHGEHLNDKTGKMSKSKGDFLTLSLLKEKGYDPLVYRMFCLQSHYRNQLVFSYEAMDITTNAYNKLINKIKSIKDNNCGKLDQDKINNYKSDFIKALENDLNTSSALTVLYNVLKDNEISNKTKLFLVGDFDKVLSLDLLNDSCDVLDLELKEYIETMINLRNEAKKNKDYNRADEIRNELLNKKIVLKDTKDGTIYEIK